MGKKGFKDLIVWQKAKDLAISIYKISEDGKFARDFGLRDQIRRSAVSVPSNIAEGDERNTDKESVRFFFIAKGSLAELRTQIQIAFEIGYIGKDVYENIDSACHDLGGMIGKLIKVRQEANGKIQIGDRKNDRKATEIFPVLFACLADRL